jgi:vitamin B12 transporter
LHSKLESQYDSGTSAYDTHSTASLDTAVYGKVKFLPNVDTLVQYSESRDKGQNGPAPQPATRIDTRQTDISVQNDVRIGEDVLQLLYDHRKEEVSTNGSDALNRERSTNSWAASYNARRGANLLNAAIRRDNSVYGSKNTGSVGYGYDITCSCAPPPATAPASGRRPTTSCTTRLRQRRQQAGARQERRNRHPLG